MEILAFNETYTQSVTGLFTQAFADSATPEEGEIIGNLVSNLIATTPKQDLIGYVVQDDKEITASIFFSRLTLFKSTQDSPQAFILSPVAVATAHQGKGIGQALINYGIDQLKARAIDVLFTYGDPQYYSKVGFSYIEEAKISAPYKLSQPQGWLAQSLSGYNVEAISNVVGCASALSDQSYW